ncbi:FAD binding domain-containing protein [Frigidibacter sp. MR17.24]|uniref:FAD binding domain-containing protein n=1 Tax=Frigidibacter sp. MR17.24 TaxID=3127345 RepID=UPI0030129D04
MRDFAYTRATNLAEAGTAAEAGAMPLAGGTTLVDLAKAGVIAPERVVDITRLSGLDAIETDADGARIGALATMAEVAADPGIAAAVPAVRDSLLLAASAQLRNMATIGGNLMQRTRCAYFRDPATFPACNKRAPGSGCAAIGGATRNHAILGTSPACIATAPGDLAVALMAFDAVVQLGDRSLTMAEFFPLPGTTPEVEHPLAPGEIITGIAIPASAAARRSGYLKIRDRASYEFAAASAAVGIAFEADGTTVAALRIAMGGVGTIPWRLPALEAALTGKALTEEGVRAAAALAVEGAEAQGANGFKIDLAPRVAARAILQIGGIA